MQIFQKLENKRENLSIPIGGKNVTADDLAAVKVALLDRIARESDPAAVRNLEIQLTQTNSAIKAIAGAEIALAETKLEIETKRRQVDTESQQTASVEQNEFKSNIALISVKKLYRAIPGFDLDPTFDGKVAYQQIDFDYKLHLANTLSFESAQKMANEIFAASREKREWREVVSLPQPKEVS